MKTLQNLYKERDQLIADSIAHKVCNHYGELQKRQNVNGQAVLSEWQTIKWGKDNIQACRNKDLNKAWITQAIYIAKKISERRTWLKYNTALTKGEVLINKYGSMSGDGLRLSLKNFKRIYQTDKIELIGYKTKYEPEHSRPTPILAVMPTTELFNNTLRIDTMRAFTHNDKSGTTLAAEKLKSTEDEDFDVYRLITFTTDDDGNIHFHKHYAASYDLPTAHAGSDTKPLFAMVKTRKNLDQRLSTIANKWLKSMDTHYTWNRSYLARNEVPNYIATNLGRMIHYSELALIRKTVFGGYAHDSFEANAMLAILQSNS